MHSQRVLLFAMEGLFSRVVFDSLLEQGTDFCGVVLPSRSAITKKPVSHNPLNVLNTASIRSLAEFHDIAVYAVTGNSHDQYQQIMQRQQPDIILVACFPYRLPEQVFTYPRQGAYNIHPSLLPHYRGPVPLFWQFYHGDTEGGVTLHRIDAGFDTGEIVLQQSVHFNDGISGSGATLQLARAAVKQTALLLNSIERGKITSTPQASQSGSYYSWPGIEHFSIPVSWNVRRAFNFMRATQHWKQAYRIINNDQSEVMVREAIGYSNSPLDWAANEAVLQLAFCDGFLQASG